MPVMVAAQTASHNRPQTAEHKRSLQTPTSRLIALNRIDEYPLLAQYRKLVKGVTLLQETLLAQLRMGHVPLTAYLNRIGKATTTACVCGYNRETVYHYRFQCPSHEHTRRVIPRRMKTLEQLLATRDGMPLLFQYIKTTNRFASARIT